MSDVRQTEFSHPVSVDRLNETETFLKLSANEKERKSLSDRFGVASIESLNADVRIEPKSKGKKVQVMVDADISAKVTQTCVVTLDPIKNEVHTKAQVHFVSDEPEISGGDEIWGEDDDLPDLIIDGVIDVGELVAEQVALLLDPFPRSLGVQFDIEDKDVDTLEGVDKRPHPFAVLEKLKGKFDDNT
jgi:uncharacterized metal-binding protein YceD (DUF177 family)